jgi:hypothetical protein
VEIELAGPGLDDIRIGGTYKAIFGSFSSRSRPASLLAERSRPHVCPTQTPEDVVQALIEAR